MSGSIPFGPNTASSRGQTIQPTLASQSGTIGAADLNVSSWFLNGVATRLYANSAGTVFIKFADDVTATGYVVTAGTKIDGRIVLIGGTTNYPGATNGLGFVLETG
jgi:hypothetical protein